MAGVPNGVVLLVTGAGAVAGFGLVVRGLASGAAATAWDIVDVVLPALALVGAVRANTVALIRRMPDETWQRVGRHSESGRYSAEDWLTIYAEHLEGHARQIESNVAAWRAAGGRAT